MNEEFTKEFLEKYFSTKSLSKNFGTDKKEFYMDLLRRQNIKNVFDDNELIATAKLFFNNDLNLSKTSKNAFMHRNTLIYRLEKINKLIGLNLKCFDDAAIFYNMMEMYNEFIC